MDIPKKPPSPSSRTQVLASAYEVFKSVEEEPPTGTSGRISGAEIPWHTAFVYREDIELKRDIRTIFSVLAKQNELIIQLLQRLDFHYEASQPEGLEEFEIRDVTEEQAKQEILELFQKSPRLFYSDVAEILHLDLPLVVKICNELEAEGRIKPAS